MSSRRTMILIGAIALGAFAAFALLNYVDGVRDDVLEEAEPVRVLISTVDIPAGTPATEALASIVEVDVPRTVRPATFVAPSDREQLAGLYALGDIAANQIIVNNLFVDSTVVATSFRDQIPVGNVAFALSTDGVRGVGGYIQPGDEVNIMVVGDGVQVCNSGDPAANTNTSEIQTDGAPAADSSAGGSSEGGFNQEKVAGPGKWTVTYPENLDNEFAIDDEVEYDIRGYCAVTFTKPARYLYQRVEVLAVGERQVVTPGTEDVSTAVIPTTGTLILSVPNRAAQILASIDSASLYLTLVPNDYEAEPLPPLTLRDFEGPLPAEGPVTEFINGTWSPIEGTVLTPYGPDGFIEGDDESDVVGDIVAEQIDEDGNPIPNEG